MTVELIKHAFVAGELSPKLYGRTDLEKYELAVAEARNWFVDYQGGLSNRPGTQLVEIVREGLSGGGTKFFPFQYAPNLENTYVVQFGHNYVRFIQDGAYIVTAEATITGITKANPAVVTTSAAHGYYDGAWVYFDVAGMTELNGRPFQLSNVTPTTFELEDVITGENVNSNGFGTFTSGTVSIVYEETTTYTGEQLERLRATQRRDYLRLTHPSHPVRNLIRNDHDDWTLEAEAIENTAPIPDGLEVEASATGNAEVGFVVTAVMGDGEESFGSIMTIADSIVNYAAEAGMVAVQWNPVTGARHYNVYRTHISSDGESSVTFGAGNTGGGITKADMVGWVGRSFGTTFNDNNIIPDFTRHPPLHYNPFANGRIEHINITNSGSGYGKNTATVTVDIGTGFVGIPIVNDDGQIVAVKIVNGGSGYTNASVVTFGGGGAGATGTIERSPSSGNYPSVSVIYEQRQLYAATNNDPLTVFASKIGLYSNFDTSEIVTDSDSWEHEIESQEVAPIAHMLDVRGGLLVASQAGVWLMHGTEGIGEPITGSSAVAKLQSNRGMSTEVDPIQIDSDILYVEGKNTTVRLMEYSELRKAFEGRDMSILSTHLFETGKKIVRWAHAQNPHNLIIAVREDGHINVLTLVKEQDVFAWCPWDTTGLYRDVCVIHENGQDSIYLAVDRDIDGVWRRYVERVAPREFPHVEDAWFLDCALQTSEFTPNRRIGIVIDGETCTITSATGTPFADRVGQIVRAAGGKAIIDSVSDGGVVANCTIIRDFTDYIPGTDLLQEIDPGDWTVEEPFDVVGGLWHLAGMEVYALVDGSVQGPFTVNSDGEITLTEEGTTATVGLLYQSVGRTLPPSASDAPIEHLRKSIPSLFVRVHETRGLEQGPDLDHLRPMRERTNEPLGEPTNLLSQFKAVAIDSRFDESGQVYFVQNNPLPATVLGIVKAIDLGDDPDNREPRRR